MVGTVLKFVIGAAGNTRSQFELAFWAVLVGFLLYALAWLIPLGDMGPLQRLALLPLYIVSLAFTFPLKLEDRLQALLKITPEYDHQIVICLRGILVIMTVMVWIATGLSLFGAG